MSGSGCSLHSLRSPGSVLTSLLLPVPHSAPVRAAIHDVSFPIDCEKIYLCFYPLAIQLWPLPFDLIISAHLFPSFYWYIDPFFKEKKNDPYLLVPCHRTSIAITYLHYFRFQNKIIWWLSMIRKVILENRISVCYIKSFLGLLDIICCISLLERELLSSFPDGSIYEHLVISLVSYVSMPL